MEAVGTQMVLRASGWERLPRAEGVSKPGPGPPTFKSWRGRGLGVRGCGRRRTRAAEATETCRGRLEHQGGVYGPNPHTGLPAHHSMRRDRHHGKHVKRCPLPMGQVTFITGLGMAQVPVTERGAEAQERWVPGRLAGQQPRRSRLSPLTSGSGVREPIPIAPGGDGQGALWGNAGNTHRPQVLPEHVSFLYRSLPLIMLKIIFTKYIRRCSLLLKAGAPRERCGQTVPWLISTPSSLVQGTPHTSKYSHFGGRSSHCASPHTEHIHTLPPMARPAKCSLLRTGNGDPQE